MKFLLKLFKGPIKNILVRQLQKESNKRLVVALINEKMDIPNLTEEEEGRLLSQVLDAANDAIAIALERL